MPDRVSHLVRLVRERIASAADPDRAEPMRAYMKSAMPYRGVMSVPLRGICKATYDEHRLPDRDACESAVRELWDGAAYREERYAAMALTRHRHYRAFQDPATLALYRHLVVSGAWWDYVDSLASHNIGDLLGAAAARPRRPGLGAGVRRRARGPAVQPVETRGSQAPVTPRLWRWPSTK